MKFHLLTILIPIFIFAALAVGIISPTEASGNNLAVTKSSPVLPILAPTTISPILAEIYGDVTVKEEQKRLRELAATLKKKKFKTATLCIIAYAEQKSLSEEMLIRAARAKDYLIEKQKIDSNRFYIVDGGDQKKSTLEFYILPPGASLPTPNL